ncbi:hypothetical protein SAY87_000392 [Trapa incisa]|uniref:Uncharacterized protein n=1 Tax=Trapa incisa TaxID=236973 RepID=A0AAN7GC00_9MYRT|nr:hypothetical protein SAY87_000392 [Trapa incisa]
MNSLTELSELRSRAMTRICESGNSATIQARVSSAAFRFRVGSTSLAPSLRQSTRYLSSDPRRINDPCDPDAKGLVEMSGGRVVVSDLPVMMAVREPEVVAALGVVIGGRLGAESGRP